MTIHLCTFATDDMSRSAQLCIDSAEKHGVDSHSRYNAGNIMHCDNMREYWPAMDRMFSHARGCGYWSWKPLIIKTDMELMNDDDIILYSDAGIEFIAPISHIIERMGHDKPQDDVWLFGNNWEHAHWCKRSVIETIWPIRGYGILHDDLRERLNWERFGKQCQASVIFFRVSDYSRSFVAEWLKWCLLGNGQLVDDSPSWYTNHPEFREHRHDQAILTTMAYRDGIRLHWWGARYNIDQPGGGFVYDKLPEYAADDYDPFVHHHRRRNYEWNQVA